MQHRRLQEQIHTYFGGPGAIPEAYSGFLNAVSEAYEGYENNRPVEGVEQGNDRQGLKVVQDELNMLFNNISEVLFSVDMIKYRLIHISPACEKVYGYTPAEFLATESLWQDVIYHEDRHIAEQHMKDLYKGEVFHQYRIIHKDGSIRWIENRIRPSFDADGRLERLDGITGDVTEKVLTDLKLKQSRKMMEAAQRVARFGSWELSLVDFNDLSENPLVWSEEVFHIFGYDPHTHKPSVRNFFATVYAEDKKAIMKTLRRAVDGKSTYSIEHRIVHTDGTVRWVKGDAAMMMDESGGGLLKMIGTVQDITERREVEEKLRKSERMMANAQRIAHFGSWEVDLLYNDAPGLNPLRWSEEVYRIFGMDPRSREVTVDDFYKAVHPRDLAQVKASFVKALAKNTYYTVEYRIMHPDGNIHWLQQGASVVAGDNSRMPSKMVGTVQDITTRKVAERALRESELNLTAIIENTNALIYSLDKEFRYITFNSRMKDIIVRNYGFEIRPGMRVFEFLEKTDAEEAAFWKNTYSEAIKGKPLQFVKDYSTPAVKNYTQFFINPILENQRVIGLSCMVCDITKQKTAEDLLRKSEANLQAIFDHTETVYILLDKNANIVSFNPAAERWAKAELRSEFRVGELLMSYSANRHSEMKEKVEKVLKGEPVNYEIDYPQPDGSEHCYAVKIRPILDGEKEIVGICIAADDVTERKHAEASLQKSEANLRTIFRHTENAYLLINPDLNVVSFNQKVVDFAKKDLGRVPEEGKYVISFFAEERRREIKKMMEDVLGNSKLQYRYEINYFQKDLSYTWYDVRIFGVLDAAGQVSGVMMVLSDISEQKAAGDKMKLSEERYRLVSESTLLGVAWGSIGGTLLNANKAFCDMLEYSREKMLNTHFSKFTHPDDVVKEMGYIHKMLQGEINSYQFEKRLITSRKNIIWVESSASCVKDDLGEIQFVITLTQDITSRKQTERFLQESEERYRQIVETSQEGIWMVDDDSRTIFVNKKMTEICGFSAEEMMGRYMFDFMDDEGKAMAIKTIKRYENKHENREFRFVTKSGQYIWTNLSTTPIAGEDGRYTGILAMVTDITNRKQAEEAFYKSEANLRNILENTDTAYVLLDRKANILSYNSLAKKLSKHQFDGALEEGKNYVRLMGIDQRKAVQKVIRHVIATEKQISYETKYDKGKSTTWLYVSMHPIFNPDKKMLGLSVATTDITMRKLSEELLQKSEANLRTIFDNTTVSYVLLDVSFCIVSYNKRAARGYKKELGRPLAEGSYFMDYLSGDRKAQAEKRYAAVMKGEKIVYETSFVQPDESLAWYKISLFPVSNGEGNIYGLVIASEDITNMKRTELERETMTADIVQRNKDLEQFAYIISHNLRSPVANILGLANVIRQTTALSKADMDKCLEGLFMSVEKLDEVIIDLNYILQVRREISEKKEVVNFSKIISDVKQSIDNLVKKEKVTIIEDFNEVEHFFTLKTYLNSIFYNLISNSIKYCIPNTPPVIEIKSRRLKDKIEIVYKDNGLGIDLSLHHDKIFGLYKKFHLHKEGKGMGLYMVKTQVEILGGKISIKSEKNQGVKFLIEFTSS